ncbi:MAG: hypothetical protein II921_05440, partial [Treponema sp.]|nr:hypothetical protein [Treponema sp.]
MKEKSSPFLKILSVVAAIALAHLFSLIPFSVENDAKGFDGDTSKSGFVEMSPTGNDVQLIFSETERAEIDGAVKKAAEKLQMNILVYASRSPLSDYDTEFFCDDNYDEMYGPDTDGIFYYMDLSGKSPAYDYLSTSGKAILAYQAAKDNIFYALDKYLPSSVDVQANGLEPYKEGIAGAVHEFLDQIDSYS